MVPPIDSYGHLTASLETRFPTVLKKHIKKCLLLFSDIYYKGEKSFIIYIDFIFMNFRSIVSFLVINNTYF